MSCRMIAVAATNAAEYVCAVNVPSGLPVGTAMTALEKRGRIMPSDLREGRDRDMSAPVSARKKNQYSQQI